MARGSLEVSWFCAAAADADEAISSYSWSASVWGTVLNVAVEAPERVENSVRGA